MRKLLLAAALLATSWPLMQRRWSPPTAISTSRPANMSSIRRSSSAMTAGSPSIADARTVRWGADVKHIDLAGKTLLPGLIDMHVHLDGPADIGGYRGLEFTDSFWQATAVGNARAMLDAGFTTVRNVGSGMAQRHRPQAGDRKRICHRAAHRPGRLCAGRDRRPLRPDLSAAQPGKIQKEEGVGDGPEELRYQVRRQRKFGAEVIKVCATGGVFSRNTEPGSSS